MIVEIDSAAFPSALVIDTGARGGGGSFGPLLHPSIKVRTSPGGTVLASWQPNGDPEEFRQLSFGLMILGALLVTFAVVGVVKTL